jgi:hypothetical protein
LKISSQKNQSAYLDIFGRLQLKGSPTTTHSTLVLLGSKIMKKHDDICNFISDDDLETYKKWQQNDNLYKVVKKQSRGKSLFIHHASPTFSYHSHERWGSRHCCALNALHELYPATVCGTIMFNGGNKETIANFLSSYAEKMRYEAAKTPEKIKSALFGVLEMRPRDYLLHMHWLARNFEVQYMEDHIRKYNKKFGTRFQLKYYRLIKDIDGYSAYIFKFNYDNKLIFTKGALKRYVFHCGNYFMGNKKKLEREGLKNFISQKIARKSDHKNNVLPLV